MVAAPADASPLMRLKGCQTALTIVNPSNFDPRKFLAAATQAMTDICIARYEAFGTAGQASKQHYPLGEET